MVRIPKFLCMMIQFTYILLIVRLPESENQMAIFKTGNGEQGTGNGEQGTGNGERGTGNGERGTGNGERGTGNGERGTGNGERGTGNGERGTGNGERYICKGIFHFNFHLYVLRDIPL